MVMTVILGGDQLDDIESGDGKNFVSSGKADLDGNQQVDQNELDLINSQISETTINSSMMMSGCKAAKLKTNLNILERPGAMTFGQAGFGCQTGQD